MKQKLEKLVDSSVKILSSKWQLDNLEPLVKMPLNNYVAKAYSQEYKKDVVLKILIADTNEPETLKYFDGNGCIKLLKYDQKHKGLLLEYISPGLTLKTLFPENDLKAIEITADIIKKMHKRNLAYTKNTFPTINQWLDLLKTFQTKKININLLKKAQILSDKLLNLKQDQFLLHGDLHHENILKDHDDWIAIDPKGVIGPLEYEVGRFIMNPIPDLLERKNSKEIINKRIEMFSEIFNFEKKRIYDWVFVQAVLSACWTEKHGNEEFFNYFVNLAETFEF